MVTIVIVLVVPVGVVTMLVGVGQGVVGVGVVVGGGVVDEVLVVHGVDHFSPQPSSWWGTTPSSPRA